MSAYSEIFIDKPGGVGSFKNKVLFDTGNNFYSLINKDILNEQNIQYWPLNITAYSVDLKPISIIGKVTLNFKFPGINKTFKETFYIPYCTSRVINLSVRFLHQNKINLMFSENKVMINESESVDLLNFSTDKVTCAEIKQIPILGEELEYSREEVKIPGIQTHRKSAARDLDLQKFNLKLDEEITIYPGGVWVYVQAPTASLYSKEWYVAPTQNKICVRNNVMVMEGVYRPGKDGRCKINIVNCSSKKVTLQKGIKIGQAYKSIQSNETKVNNNIGELSTTDLLARIRFIKDKLRLDDNEIMKNDPKLKTKVINLCLDYYDIFSQNDSDIGNTDLLDFNIELKEGAQPTKSRVIPLNPTYEKALKDQLESWLASGVISEGISEWSSPIFAVKKKGVNGNLGKLRFVIDYRLLNNVTEKIAWPLPLIADNLSRLGEGKVFTTLDLTQAYHAMSVQVDSRRYTAFSANNKQYIFNRLPFGLTNAPAYFCRLMQQVMNLTPEISLFALSYLDDIIVFSKSNSDHLIHLEKMFKVIKAARLKLNLHKCNLFTKETSYLGHLISENGTKMDESYLDKVKQWSRPTTGKEIQRFLGFTNYYREFFPLYAKLCCKLDSLRNVDTIQWTDELNKEWENFKGMFNDVICKGYPQWENPEPFIFDIDYSSNYYAGVVSQKQDGKERVIGIASKKCNACESSYPSWKGEMACLSFILKQFLHLARFRPFIVRTDSMSLTKYKTWTKNSLNGVTFRWIVFLQSFEFSIEHRKGSKHINADFMSRGKFDCITHKVSECQLCVDNSTLDPYLDDNPCEDQIFNIEGVNQEGVKVGTDLKSWLLAIQNDVVLSKIRKWVLENKILDKKELENLQGREEILARMLPHLIVENGILIVKQPLPDDKYVSRPVVPLSLYNDIFELAHSKFGSGHKGMAETMLRMNNTYYLPGINKYVEARVKNCVICLRKIGKSPKHKSVISHTASNQRVWGYVSIDLIGPLTPTVFKGKTVKHILILVCLYSRYVYTLPIVDTTAECTVKALLDDFIPTYGLFAAVRSDRGTNFSSKIFQGIMTELGIKAVLIPARNPNSNPVERQNQSIYNGLKTNIDLEDKDWASKLKLATFVINISKSRRTGYSPYFLMFGRQPILPLNLFSPVEQNDLNDLDCNSYIEFVRRVEQIIANIVQKEGLYLEFENRTRANKCEFDVNDIVYAYFDIVKVGLSRKLQSFFAGPFIITHKHSDILFEICPIHNCNVTKNHVVSRDKLRKITSQVKVCGEKLSFNVFPSDLILPSQEIVLSYSDSDLIIKDNSFEENNWDDYVRYSDIDPQYSGEDDMSNDNENANMASSEGNIVGNENVQNSSNADLVDIPAEREKDFTMDPQHLDFRGDLEYSDVNIDQEREKQSELSHVPNESSFWDIQPEQSSPRKLVTVPETSGTNLPAYLYGKLSSARKKYGTRSSGQTTHYEVGDRKNRPRGK